MKTGDPSRCMGALRATVYLQRGLLEESESLFYIWEYAALFPGSNKQKILNPLRTLKKFISFKYEYWQLFVNYNSPVKTIYCLSQTASPTTFPVHSSLTWAQNLRCLFAHIMSAVKCWFYSAASPTCSLFHSNCPHYFPLEEY